MVILMPVLGAWLLCRLLDGLSEVVDSCMRLTEIGCRQMVQLEAA